MNKLAKIYNLYHATGAVLIVLIVLTGAIFYSFYGAAGTQTKTPNITTKIQGEPCTVSDSEIGIDPQEQQMKTLINQYRQSKGLPALSLNLTLTKAAAWTASDDATKGFLDPNHIDSLGRSYEQRISDCGYPDSASNLTAVDIQAQNSNPDPASTLTLWENHEPHNIVILSQVEDSNGGAPHSENWTVMGVARAFKNGSWYWVVDFGLTDDGSGSPGGGGGGGSSCDAPNILDCGQFCHAPGTQDNEQGCCDPRICKSGNCVNFVCQPSTCNPGEILDCGAFCHVPGTQDDGQGCCDSRICKSGSCVHNVCAPKVTSPPVTQPPLTKTPTLSPTSVPNPTATNIPGQPTATPTNTPTGTALTVSVTLPGIGADSNVGENPNPVILTKQGQVALQGDALQNISFVFQAGSFIFTAQINGQTNTSIKVRIDNSLWRESSTNGQPIDLVTGDLNQDNVLDLEDYNIFLSCYGSKQCQQKQTADLNIDGVVDEKDLNIFYSGLANRTGD